MHNGRRLQLFGPGERVAVGRSMVQVDVHVDLSFFRDERRIEPGAGCELVPQVVAVLAPRRNVPCCRRLGDSEISSSIFWVNGALIDTSTVVTSMRGHAARSTICAASGSNQKLNSWRGLVANSGSSVCGLRLPPIRTIPWVSEAKLGIDRDGERDVGEWSRGIDRHLLADGRGLAG